MQMECEAVPPCPFSPVPSHQSPPSLVLSAEQPYPFASISSHVEMNLLSSTTFPLPPDLSFALRCSCVLTLRQRLYLSLMSYPLNL